MIVVEEKQEEDVVLQEVNVLMIMVHAFVKLVGLELVVMSVYLVGLELNVKLVFHLREKGEVVRNVMMD